MRTYYYLILFTLIFTLPLMAQNPVPNAGFENWSNNNPDNWVTTNIPGYTPITQSTNSHSGSYAVRGEILDVAGNPLVPAMYSETNGTPSFAVSQRYASLTGYYQFDPQGDDNLYLVVDMLKGENPIGGGGITIENAASTYTQFTVNLQYATGDVPDSCMIGISLYDSTESDPDPGSVFLMDDLAFEGVVALEQTGESNVPREFTLAQNYPNPFNPTTTFKFSLPKTAEVRLEIFTPLGQKVATVVDKQMSVGSYEFEWQARDLPSGMYFYRLTADPVSGQKFVQTRKLVLMK